MRREWFQAPTADLLFEYASERGEARIEVIIAGAGGAAHCLG